MSGRAAAIALAAAAIAIAAGCGDDSEQAPATKPRVADRESKPAGQPAPQREVEPVPCPDGLAGCRSARGTILYVERVDPDGDGDAHFVLASKQSITAPGISVIDVAAALRPHPLPGPGERLAAAGPVQNGSYGQSQIHAVAVEVGG